MNRVQDILQATLGYFDQGGFVMWPLTLGAMVLWFAAGARWTLLQRGSIQTVRTRVEGHLKASVRERATGVLDEAIAATLIVCSQSPSHRAQDRMEEALAPIHADLARYATPIQVITAVAPLAGLLGTVSGMIETFDSMREMSLFSQSGGIAGGISQALFTTQMGLAVAIPGLLAGRALERKERTLRDEISQVRTLVFQAHYNPQENP